VTATTTDFAAMAAAADAIFARVAADQRADDLMYQLGYQAGHDSGVDESDDRDAESWAKMAAWLRRSANSPSYDELCRRRGEDPTDPCPTRCGRCSRCVRSRAWQANGQADYPGAGGA